MGGLLMATFFTLFLVPSFTLTQIVSSSLFSLALDAKATLLRQFHRLAGAAPTEAD